MLGSGGEIRNASPERALPLQFWRSAGSHLSLPHTRPKFPPFAVSFRETVQALLHIRAKDVSDARRQAKQVEAWREC